MDFPPLPVDVRLMEILNSGWGPVWDSLMLFLSGGALYAVLAGFALGVVLRRKGRAGLPAFCIVALLAGAAIGTADFASGIVKDTLIRERPLNSLPGVRAFRNGEWRVNPADYAGKDSDNQSFFSGHAANTAAAAAVICAFVPQASPVLYLVPFGVGVSRVYVGKHFPSDVMAGWLAGAGIGKVWTALYRALRRRFAAKASFLPNADG